MKRKVHGLMALKKQKKEGEKTFSNCANCVSRLCRRKSKKRKGQCLSYTFIISFKKVITVCLGRVCLLKYISMYVRVLCLSRRSLRLRNHLVLDLGKLLTQQLKIGSLFSKSTLLFVPFFLS